MCIRDRNWDTHPIYKIMREDTIDLDALSPLLTEYNCQYLILNKMCIRDRWQDCPVQIPGW